MTPASSRTSARPDPALVAALHYELAGYRQRGNAERAADVVEQLKALGDPVPKLKPTTTNWSVFTDFAVPDQEHA